jgi:hypothetical protein
VTTIGTIRCFFSYIYAYIESTCELGRSKKFWGIQKRSATDSVLTYIYIPTQSSATSLLLHRLTGKDVYKNDFLAYMQTWEKRPRTPKGTCLYVLDCIVY